MAKEPKDASPFVPKRSRKLSTLAKAAQACRGCELYQKAEHVVFGEGSPSAVIMMVGEQPGDMEDHAGRPFIGPAGQLLRRALAEAGINEGDVYFTNAVKHFRWRSTSGKRRIHEKPGASHVNACHPWLAAEEEAIHPRLIICLGTTAAQALLHRTAVIKKDGYRFLPHGPNQELLILPHPSSVLRLPDHDARQKAYQAMLLWLQEAKKRLGLP